MYTENDKKRMERIRTMLMEFVTRNFAYRLERTESNDEIEALTALLNMTAEESMGSLLHLAHVNQYETYKHLSLIFFMLDKDDTIMTFSPGAKQLVTYDELREKPFYSILTDKSKRAWTRLKAKPAWKETTAHEEYIELSFKTKEDLIFTTNCLVSRPINGTDQPGRIMVTAVDLVKGSEEMVRELRELVGSGKETDTIDRYVPHTKHEKARIKLFAEDIRKLRQVREYILNNLEGSIPPIKQLANSVGTNEYKLKYGFKKLYGQTVRRFIVHERLRKASLLVQHTDIPFTRIALKIGLKNAGHFSRLFKEKYGYTPSELRKQTSN